MKKLIFLTIATGALFFTACNSVTLAEVQVQKPAVKVPTASKTQYMILYGLLNQPAVVDTAEICGGANKVSAVQSRFSNGDILIYRITGGIITPISMDVYCEK